MSGRRKRSVAGLAQPRADGARSVTKQIRLTPEQAKVQESAARAENRTWSAWIIAAAEDRLARSGR